MSGGRDARSRIRAVKIVLTYLDQNALIKLAYAMQREDLRQRFETYGKANASSVVLSPWHLVETANTNNIDNAVKLASFIDALDPKWLLDRHDIRTLEVTEDFCKFLRVDYPTAPRVTTRRLAFATLRCEDVSAVTIIRGWVQAPERLKPLENAYKMNSDSLLRIRAFKKAGKLTPEFLKSTNRKLLEVWLPESTPHGLTYGRELRLCYLDQANIDNIPTLSIEYAISTNEWRLKGNDRTDRNTLIDKFHVVSALPYVDEIVTDDGLFKTIYPVATETGHVRAKLVSNSEFFERF